jgi:hypothetical protein
MLPRSLRVPAALVLVLLPAACSAPRPAVDPVAVLGAHDLRYHASYASGGLPMGTFEPIDVDPDAPERRRIRVSAELVSLERELAARIFGPRAAGLCSFRIPAGESERLVDWLRAEGLEPWNTSAVEQYDGQRSYIAVVNQRAYVAAFEVEASPDALIADPRIDVLSSGFLLDLRGELTEAGSIDLEPHVSYARTPSSIPTRTMRIPGSSTPVTLQLPEVLLEELSTRVALAPDEVLVLGGLEGEDGRALFVLLRAEEPGDEPAGGIFRELLGN